MSLSSRAGYVLIVVGLVFVPISFIFTGSTAVLCPQLDGVAYNAIGVHLGKFRITGIKISNLAFFWYDGCNHRISSLIPVLLGVVSIGLGTAVVRREKEWFARSNS